jgi:hypothetical protein
VLDLRRAPLPLSNRYPIQTIRVKDVTHDAELMVSLASGPGHTHHRHDLIDVGGSAG